jgi:N-acetylglutamate synthase-like GNAT family acetyltransferase
MIRRAQPEDAEAIASLIKRSIREVCGPTYGNDEELLSFWCANKTAENMRRGIENPNNYWVVAVENDNAVGTALLSLRGKIDLCFLLPEYLGRGIGKAMLVGLIDKARELGIKKITLESTRTSRKFYKRNGFIELGEIDWMGRVPSYQMELDIEID